MTIRQDRFPKLGRLHGLARHAFSLITSIGLIIVGVQANAQCPTDATTLCTGTPPACSVSGTHSLGPDCDLDFSGRDVTVGTSGRFRSTGTAPFSLSITANTLNLFGDIDSSGGAVVIEVDGSFQTGSASEISIRSGTTAEQGSLEIYATTVDLVGVINANGGSSNPDAGYVYIDAESVDVGGEIRAEGASGGAGGSVEIYGYGPGGIDVESGGSILANGVTGAAPGGEVLLGSGGPITIAGQVRVNSNGGEAAGFIDIQAEGALVVDASISANGAGSLAGGGYISLAAEGALTTNAGIEANGGSSGYGGEIYLSAGTHLDVTAPLQATVTGDADGGSITAEGGTASIASQWNVNGGSNSGAGGWISVEMYDGALNLTSASTLQAAGKLEAGGQIYLSAATDLTVDGTCNATSTGAGAAGGEIVLQTHFQEKITVTGSLTTTGSDDDGMITVGPACDVELNDAAITGGEVRLVYHGELAVTDSTLAAVAADGGNIAECRCPDTDVDGVCDSLTCLVGPAVTSSSVTPGFVLAPEVKAVCTGCPNGVKEPDPPFNEECDDGNYIDDDTCANDCMSTCGNGVPNAGEECDEGMANGSPESCCAEDCEFRSGTCASDDNECTNDVCNAAGVCTHVNNTAPCVHDDLCIVGESCSGGACTGTNNCAKAQMVLLFDTSGSMNLKPDGTSGAATDRRIALAKQAAAPFLDMMNTITDGQGQFGIARFPEQPQTACDAEAFLPHMTPVGTGMSTAISTTIAGLTPQGSTPLIDGLDKARGMFGADTNRAIVLLTDGYHNCPSIGAPDTDPLVQDAIDDLEADGAKVFAVGFGKPEDPPLPLLQMVTAGTMGSYHDATEDLGYSPPAAWDAGNALKDAFKGILANTFGLDMPADPFGEIGGGSVVSHDISIIDRDRVALFLLNWRTPDADRLVLRVRSSDGEAVSATAAGVQASGGETYRLITVKPEFLQQAGKVGRKPWKVEIDAGGVDAGASEPYHYSAIVDSALNMTTSVEPRQVRTGDEVTLTATLTDRGVPLAGLRNVSVRVTRPREGMGNLFYRNPVSAAAIARATAAHSQSHPGDTLSPTALRALAIQQAGRLNTGRTGPRRVRLYDNGTHGDAKADDGVYTARFRDTRREGTFAFQFEASGPLGGGAVFKRQSMEQRYVGLSFDSDRSIVRLAKPVGNQVMVTVTPRDRFGNYLGPDRAQAVSLVPSRGRMVDQPAGDGSGRYTQILELPEGVDPREVTIDVKPPQTVRPEPEEECSVGRFFKKLFGCED